MRTAQKIRSEIGWLEAIWRELDYPSSEAFSISDQLAKLDRELEALESPA